LVQEDNFWIEIYWRLQALVHPEQFGCALDDNCCVDFDAWHVHEKKKISGFLFQKI
jgi:hypothetical protein